MDVITNFLGQNWVGSVIGLVGVLLAALFYMRSQSVHRLAYQSEGISLIAGDGAELPPDVEVAYRGKKVNQLTMTRVVYWNDGNVTIVGSDIVEKDPVRIEIQEGAAILNAQVARATRGVNAFTVVKDSSKENVCILRFDFLDPGDGANIEILHTSKESFPTVKGTVRGIPDGMTDLGLYRGLIQRRPPPKSKVLRKILDLINPTQTMFGIMFLSGLYVVARGLVPEWRQIPELQPAGIIWKSVLGGAFILLFSGLAFWASYRRFPRVLSEQEPTI